MNHVPTVMLCTITTVILFFFLRKHNYGRDQTTSKINEMVLWYYHLTNVLEKETEEMKNEAYVLGAIEQPKGRLRNFKLRLALPHIARPVDLRRLTCSQRSS